MTKKWVEHRVLYKSKGSRRFVQGGMGCMTQWEARGAAAVYEMKGYGEAVAVRVECKARGPV